MNYTKTTLADAHKRMAKLELAHAQIAGYDAGNWCDNEYFALLRLRGMCHTVYVVHDIAGGAYLVVDLHIDGGPHTSAEISDPISSWGDAILTATRKVLLEDTEITETLTPAQADALRATA